MKIIIVDRKKFYAKDIEAAKHIECANGWDTYDGRNHQHYGLYWDEPSNLVILKASNSGDCYGDYSTKYFSSPMAFAHEYSAWSSIFENSEEEEELVDRFVSQILDRDGHGGSEIPVVAVKVCDGIVQAVYANSPVSVDVYDLDASDFETAQRAAELEKIAADPAFHLAW